MVALHEQQFKLFYQPILDSETGKVKCLEALIRWQHPEKALFLLPISFLLQKGPGKSSQLANGYLDRLVRKLKPGICNMRLKFLLPSICLPYSLKSGFLSDLQQLLAEIEFPHELLKLEVTESMLIASGDKSIEILKMSGLWVLKYR